VTSRNRRRFALAIVAAMVIAALSWLAIVTAGGDVPMPTVTGVTDSNTVPAQSEAAARSTIAKAKVEARAHTTNHVAVLPPNPPPMGVPTWVRVRPGDHAPAMPTPRGSYPK